MESFTVGNIKVLPFDFAVLQELTIEKNINEHATLYVKGVVKDGWNIIPVTDAAEYTNIKCEDGVNTYFSGVLQNVVITSEDDVYYLEAHAISHTIKLDTQRHTRSFQYCGKNYRDIVRSIIGDNGGIVSYHADPHTVDKILVQYDETDWQFAKRLASHTQDVLLSISKSDDPELHFGVEDGCCAGEIITNHFSVSKDFNLLRSRSNDDSPLGRDSITMYKVNTEDFVYGLHDVGDKVRFNGTDLYVRQAIFNLDNNIVTCSYTLSSKNAITAPKAFNRHITGLALKGTVLVAENDDVKLDLDIDYESGTDQFFKYATDYSPESHTGWYVMPEVGDTVFLVFPTDDESDAHASSSMRQNSTGKTGDPLTKFLRTPFGKEVKLNDKEVLITGKDDETYVKINEDTGIEIYTLKPINIFTDVTCDINSTGKMTIHSEDDMNVMTDARLTISANDSIQMECGENIVNITPSAGIKGTTDTDINLSSTGKTNIKSVDEMAIISNNDLSVASDTQLIASGASTVDISGGAGSAKLTPDGIDLKAPLIKMN